MGSRSIIPGPACRPGSCFPAEAFLPAAWEQICPFGHLRPICLFLVGTISREASLLSPASSQLCESPGILILRKQILVRGASCVSLKRKKLHLGLFPLSLQEDCHRFQSPRVVQGRGFLIRRVHQSSVPPPPAGRVSVWATCWSTPTGPSMAPVRSSVIPLSQSDRQWGPGAILLPVDLLAGPLWCTAVPHILYFSAALPGNASPHSPRRCPSASFYKTHCTENCKQKKVVVGSITEKIGKFLIL